MAATRPTGPVPGAWPRGTPVRVVGGRHAGRVGVVMADQGLRVQVCLELDANAPRPMISRQHLVKALVR